MRLIFLFFSLPEDVLSGLYPYVGSTVYCVLYRERKKEKTRKRKDKKRYLMLCDEPATYDIPCHAISSHPIPSHLPVLS